MEKLGRRLEASMKTIKSFLSIFIILFFISCGEHLPESYGIYAVSSNNLQQLKPQATFVRGNLMESLSGLKGSSGNMLDKLKYIIVFEKDMIPSDIKLSKLIFKNGGNVDNLFGSSYVDINLWLSVKEIEINIAPLDGKKDMYKIIPVQPIDTGFYALHFGSMSNTNTYNAFNKVAFDFVIGSTIEPYKSFEEIRSIKEQVMSSNAEKLLLSINESFNNKDFNSIRKIYIRADGKSFGDNEWSTLVKGFEIWLSQSGKIMKSVITNKRINGDFATFTLKSNYEKIGTINEELDVINNNGSYYVTFIGTR